MITKININIIKRMNYKSLRPTTLMRCAKLTMALLMVLTTATAWAADITQNTAVVINSSNKSTYEGKTITGTVPSDSYAGQSNHFISEGAIVVDGIELNLTIDGFNADYSDRYSILSCISLVNNATLHLTVKGTNTLKGGYGGAGIAVPDGCTLEITAASTGTLNATGGNDCGGGAGIGSRGNESRYQYDDRYPQGLGTIIINGGTINARGGSWGNLFTNFGGAAGIGSSEFSGAPDSEHTGSWNDATYVNNITGSITINGGTINATGGAGAAGIGGGNNGTVSSITITGGNTTATGGDGAAAIGIGWNSTTNENNRLTCAAISISGGTVTANGNIGYANGSTANYTGGSVTISDAATVSCTGDINPGNGTTTYRKYNFNITIYDTALTSTISNATLTLPGGKTANADITLQSSGVGRLTYNANTVIAENTAGTLTVSGGGNSWNTSVTLGSSTANNIILGGYLYSFSGTTLDNRLTGSETASALTVGGAAVNALSLSMSASSGEATISGSFVSDSKLTSAEIGFQDNSGHTWAETLPLTTDEASHTGSAASFTHGYRYSFSGTVFDDAITTGSTASFAVAGIDNNYLRATFSATKDGEASVSGNFTTETALASSPVLTITNGSNNWDATLTMTPTAEHRYNSSFIAGNSRPTWITYKDENNNDKTITDFTFADSYSGSTVYWSGNVVVDRNFTTDQLINVSGTVNLILCDGVELKVNSRIKVVSGNTLNIFAQSGGTGKLTVNSSNNYLAAIGGISTKESHAGTIAIYGGNITANAKSNGADAAAIGGGNSNGGGGSIIIAGGNVRATNGRGIGNATYGSGATILLSWTRATDRIYANLYNGTVTLAKSFFLENTTTVATADNIAGNTLVPAANVTFGSISHGTIMSSGSAANGSLYAVGSTVTLDVTPDEGYVVESISYNGTEIEPDNGIYSFTMPAADVTVTVTFAPNPAHFSKSGDTYTIHTATGWDLFCDALQDNNTYNHFSGKTVCLDANITVSRMAGSLGHEFMGNFNGGKDTLTFTATADDNYCAPFHSVKGGSTANAAITISDLNVVTTITAYDYRHMAGLIASQEGHVNVSGCSATVNITSTKGNSNPTDLYPAALVSQASSSNGGTLTVTGCTASGTISTDGKYAGGLVGIVQGTASISDCVSSVTINSSISGDGTHGGIIAALAGTAKITGCVFAGKLITTANNSTGNCGGFIGWRNATATITDCLYAPATIGTGETEVVNGTGDYPSCTFVRNGDVKDISNSYYTRTLGTAQGKQLHSITADENVTVDFSGTATKYTVSGITAYTKGIKYNNVLYAGEGDNVGLTLGSADVPLGYTKVYTVTDENNGDITATALSGNDNDGYTLAMPAADINLTANIDVIPWTGTGDSDAPYTIIYPSQLDLLAQRVNSGNDYSGKYFQLGADIKYDYSGLGANDSNYTAIGMEYGNDKRYFKGNFDGQNHIVSGIRIYKGNRTTADGCQGLFGCIGKGAEVKNIILADAHITGYYKVGAIGGLSGGTVRNCHVLSNVTIHAVYEYAYEHGGIVGNNFGTVTHCTSAAAITSATSAAAITPTSSSCFDFGGIVGRNENTVEHCIYLGTTLEGDIYIGAIGGSNMKNATIINCYYTDPHISGKDSRGTVDNANCTLGNNSGTVAACGTAPRDNADNSDFIDLMAERTAALTAVERTTPLSTDIDLTLFGRTLYKDGYWNTICLPFDVEIEGSVLDGAVARRLTAASVTDNETSGQTLHLTFGNAVTELKAGVPYIIKWTEGDNITDPVFPNVTISNTYEGFDNGEAGDYRVRFLGTYNKMVYGKDKSVLFMGSSNNLYYPDGEVQVSLGACRAYFKIGDDDAVNAKGITGFVIDFGENDEATAIHNAEFIMQNDDADAWYTVDGIRLNGKPSKRGMYIHNGKKVVVE